MYITLVLREVVALLFYQGLNQPYNNVIQLLHVLAFYICFQVLLLFHFKTSFSSHVKYTYIPGNKSPGNKSPRRMFTKIINAHSRSVYNSFSIHRTMNAQHLMTVLVVLCTFASGQGSFFQNETDLVDAMVRTVMGCKNIPGKYLFIQRGRGN